MFALHKDKLNFSVNGMIAALNRPPEESNLVLENNFFIDDPKAFALKKKLNRQSPFSVVMMASLSTLQRWPLALGAIFVLCPADRFVMVVSYERVQP